MTSSIKSSEDILKEVHAEHITKLKNGEYPCAKLMKMEEELTAAKAAIKDISQRLFHTDELCKICAHFYETKEGAADGCMHADALAEEFQDTKDIINNLCGGKTRYAGWQFDPSKVKSKPKSYFN